MRGVSTIVFKVSFISVKEKIVETEEKEKVLSALRLDVGIDCEPL